jgi:uncharacterized protein (TIGR02117 family)
MAAWIARILMAVGLGLALAASDGTGPRPVVAGPCAPLGVWSNGAHTSLIVPAGMLAPDHPLRRPFPSALWFLIGWGDAAFYPSDGSDIELALRSLIPPRASVVHVLATTALPTQTFAASTVAWTGLTPAQQARLAAFLADAVIRDKAGAAIAAAPGQVAGASAFFKGVDGFHAFSLCNHWTAKALRAAGLAVTPWGAFTAASVTGQIRRTPICAA